MDILKLSIQHLVEEPKRCNRLQRYSHPAFTLKIPKGIIPLDYDKEEKQIEIQYIDGERSWVDFAVFFGKVISEYDIVLLHADGKTEKMRIAHLDLFQRKKTKYWKLIFEVIPDEDDLPF